MNEQRLEQLEDELAKVEMQLRCVRAELDEIGVSKVPENVKAGTFLDTLIAILCVVGGGIITLIGVGVEGMMLKFPIILLGIVIVGVGISHNVNKVSVPDKMIRYNTLEKRAQELKDEIQAYQDSKAGETCV